MGAGQACDPRSPEKAMVHRYWGCYSAASDSAVCANQVPKLEINATGANRKPAVSLGNAAEVIE